MKSKVGLLALVVQKGSNFDRVLCGLSPPDFGVGPLACIYTFWAGAVRETARSRQRLCNLRRLTMAGAFSIMPTCQEWSNVRRMGSPSQPLSALTC